MAESKTEKVLTAASFVKKPKTGKIQTVVARITRGTTISGDKRAKFVKVGDLVEIDLDTFNVLSGQGQAERVTDLAPLRDSAGGELTTR